MPQEFKTFKGYSDKNLEEALEAAISQVPASRIPDAFSNYPIIHSGKEMGGFVPVNKYYVVISALIDSRD